MTPNRLMNRSSRTRIAAAAALMLIAAATTTAHAQLVDGTFANPLVPFGAVLGSSTSPMTAGLWGHEVSTISGVVGVVTPNAGATMLNMAYGGGVTTQAGQAINLSTSYPGLVAGGAVATFGAFFNAATAGPVGGVVLSFFGSGLYSSKIGADFASAAAIDNTPGSWQQIQVTAAIPTNATWALAQVYYSNPTLVTPTGGPQAGFVDEAYLRVTAVPEPATWAMMGLGALGVAWRRRQQSRA